MKYVFSQNRILGNTGIAVSPVGIGALPMGPNQSKLKVEDGAKVISYACLHGINFIDTAQCYSTYPYIKESLKQISAQNTAFKRENLVICSKSLVSDYDGMLSAIREALKEIGTDYIDIFLMHELRSGQFEARQGAWNALKYAKSAGIVKAIGISTHHADCAKFMAEVPECDVVFSIFNYTGMGIRTGLTESEKMGLSEREKASILTRHGSLDKPGTKEEMLEAIKCLKAAGKGYFSMKIFGGGNLTSSYQTALNFSCKYLNYGLIDSLMIGFTSDEQIDDLLTYFSGEMPKSYNPDCSKKKVIVNKDDCEGCGTCIKACASNAIGFGTDGLAEIDSSKCLTCGYCAPVCPVRAIIMY